MRHVSFPTDRYEPGYEVVLMKPKGNQLLFSMSQTSSLTWTRFSRDMPIHSPLFKMYSNLGHVAALLKVEKMKTWQEAKT